MTKLELLTLTDGELDRKVRIQGTPYDRKRKVSQATVKKMQGLFSKKKTISEIAQKLGLNYTTVRYNVDPVWKAEFNAKRDGKHTGVDHISKLDRVAYKRQLVAKGRVTA